MIDLECFGQEHDAAICQIGAVWFDLEGNANNGIQLNVDARDAVRHGATVTVDTIYWWLQQEEAARKSVCEPGMTELEALTRLNEYWQDADEVWSHATYDFVIVHNAMKRRGLRNTVSFRKAMDIRTLVALAPPMPLKERIGTHHTALDDAIYQARYVGPMIKRIKDQ